MPGAEDAGARTALLVIDMQNAFFEAEDLAKCRDRLTAECNRLISAASAAGALVINIRTEHSRDRTTWTLSMHDDDQGFSYTGTAQAKPVPGLEISEADEVIKIRDSAFIASDLELRLRSLKVTDLVLCGVSTHTCVAQTAVDAYALNFRVTLGKDAIASHRPDLDAVTFAMLKDEYRQDALPTSRLIEAVGWATAEGPAAS